MNILSLKDELRSIPLLKVVIPFIIGIWLLWNLHLPLVLLICLFFVTAFIVFYLSSRYWLIRFPYILSVTTGLAIMFASSITMQLKINSNKIPNSFYDADYIALTVEEPLVEKGNNLSALCKVDAYNSNSGWKKISTHIVMKIKKPFDAMRINPSDKILLRTKPDIIHKPSNPGEFDFQNYYYLKGIASSVYVQENQVVILKGKGVRLSFKDRLFKLRYRLIRSLQAAQLSSGEQSIMSAMVLGYVNDIDSETRQAFAASGTMHILSVSGLHVGLVYVFLSYLLFFLKNRRMRFLRLFLVISGIWLYTMLCGLSAPVLRSALMFTFIALSELLKRQSHPLNTLSAAALFLLAINPFQLMDISFQLTFLAMAGIFIFNEPLVALWHPNQWLADKIWELVCVSIAAQVLTTPISLYYFHQFPSYFLLANLIVVPLSSLILYGGLIYMFIIYWPALAGFVAIGIKWLVQLLIKTVIVTESLPGSTIKSIFLTGPDVFLWYILILSIALFISERKHLAIFMALYSVILISFLYHSFSLNQNKFQSIFHLYHFQAFQDQVEPVPGRHGDPVHRRIFSGLVFRVREKGPHPDQKPSSGVRGL